MKINVNGVSREMTSEELDKFKKAEAEMQKSIPPVDEREVLEEFLDRLADAETVEEITEIAKDIKARKDGV